MRIWGVAEPAAEVVVDRFSCELDVRPDLHFDLSFLAPD